MSKKNRIIIPCRMAYLNCWRPVSQYGGPEKYSVLAIIPKDDEDTLMRIREAIERTKTSSADRWGGRIPSNLQMPLHDGDEEKPDNPAFHNTYYINAKSKEPPQVVDQNVQPIKNQTDVYSGCYGNISITFYGYNFGGSKGIGVWLGNIQKTKDGTPLGGRIIASDEFTPVVTEDFLQ